MQNRILVQPWVLGQFSAPTSPSEAVTWTGQASGPTLSQLRECLELLSSQTPWGGGQVKKEKLKPDT